MSELIDKQVAINAILDGAKQMRWSIAGYVPADAVEAVEGVPSVGWIPCTERLPEETGAYLVTCKNGNVRTAHFTTYNDKWTDARAIAWMPLPEPYTED